MATLFMIMAFVMIAAVLIYPVKNALKPGPPTVSRLNLSVRGLGYMLFVTQQ